MDIHNCISRMNRTHTRLFYGKPAVSNKNKNKTQKPKVIYIVLVTKNPESTEKYKCSTLITIIKNK